MKKHVIRVKRRFWRSIFISKLYGLTGQRWSVSSSYTRLMVKKI